MATEETQIPINVLRNQTIGIYADIQKKLIILFIILFVQSIFSPIGLVTVIIFVSAFLIAGFYANLETKKRKEIELIKVKK